MDFTNRGQQVPVGRPAASSEHTGSSNHKSRKHRTIAYLKIATVTLLFSGTILVVALLLSLVFFHPKSEQRLVIKDKYQVVVVGQSQAPYFGKIKDINSQYIRLQDIYYFKATQAVQPDQSQSQNQNLSLVKLGCEIHGPYDEMIIRRDTVDYWENLRDDGQVVKAISAYKQQNPNGQQCTSNTSSSSGTSTTPTTTTPTTNSTTKH